MKRISFLHPTFILFTILLYSCTKIVDVDVPNGGKRLVVEASIKWEKGTSGKIQTIRLSESSEYFELNNNTPVTGAEVTVSKDSDGSVYVFQDMGDGTYRTQNFEPEFDQLYTLEINYNQKTYVGQETLRRVSDINRIEDAQGVGFDSDEIIVSVYFDDPKNSSNFYFVEFRDSNQLFSYLDVASDELTDGNENKLEYEGENLKTGDVVEVELQGISEQYYRYMSILIEQSMGSDGPFSTIPVPLIGNCKNIDDSKEEVLGYFRLSEVITQQHVVVN